MIIKLEVDDKIAEKTKEDLEKLGYNIVDDEMPSEMKENGVENDEGDVDDMEEAGEEMKRQFMARTGMKAKG